MRRKHAKLCTILLLILAASMLFGCTRKTHYAETSVADKIKFFDLVMSYHWDAGSVIFDLPEYTLDVQCDSRYIDDAEGAIDAEFKTKELTTEGDAVVKLAGTYVRPDSETTDTAALRVIMKDGERIAGYALIVLWDYNADSFNSGSVVKAVTFDKVDGEYPDVTEEEVNSLLNDAMQELVIDAKLFETHNPIPPYIG